MCRAGPIVKRLGLGLGLGYGLWVMGNTSIWGSLPKFSTGYFQVILDEFRTGQVRSEEMPESHINSDP